MESKSIDWDSEILKALMFRRYGSIYNLAKSLQPLSKWKDVYKTVLRHVKSIKQSPRSGSLLERGLVELSSGKRGAAVPSLTWKGLAYTITNVDLSDSDFRKGFDRLWRQKGYRIYETRELGEPLLSLSARQCRKVVESAKSKINFDCFEEAWVKRLYLEESLDIARQEFIAQAKRHVKDKPFAQLSRNVAKKMSKIAQRDLGKSKIQDKETHELLSELLNIQETEKRSVEGRIAFLKEMLSF
jgi:hypothetical protein